MKQHIEKFLERPTGQKVGFWIGSLVILTAAYWYFVYSGLSAKNSELKIGIESLNSEILNETRLSRELPRIKEAVKDLEVKLKFALQELPDKREIPDLLSSISNLAKDAGLEIALFKPNPENIEDFYAEVPVQVSVQGTFHQVGTFFDEVGRLSRIVNISNIVLKDPTISKETKLIPTQASCIATTFRYLDESERAKTAQEEGGDNKRRRTQ